MRLMHFSRGWPRGFVLLLKEDARRETLQRLKRDYEIFEQVKLVGEDWAQNVVKRSVFQTPAVRQVVELLVADGWVCTERILRLIFARTRRYIVFVFGQRGVGWKANESMSNKQSRLVNPIQFQNCPNPRL